LLFARKAPSLIRRALRLLSTKTALHSAKTYDYIGVVLPSVKAANAE
jgi:hypothetical protein